MDNFTVYFTSFFSYLLYAVLPFSPPKGDLPPMGGMLVKMPPKCPPWQV